MVTWIAYCASAWKLCTAVSIESNSSDRKTSAAVLSVATSTGKPGDMVPFPLHPMARCNRDAIRPGRLPRSPPKARLGQVCF